jgi:uncharacterized membrane protein YoaK (UPF0700 family)
VPANARAAAHISEVADAVRRRKARPARGRGTPDPSLGEFSQRHRRTLTPIRWSGRQFQHPIAAAPDRRRAGMICWRCAGTIVFFRIGLMRERFDSETRLSWVLAGLAGLVGALAFTHSAGYYVTFMTGNTERAALGYFRAQPWLAMTATLLLAAFVGGVVVASLCRRHLWVAHPHGPTVLTALSLGAATTVCIATHGWSAAGDLSFVPIPFVAFGIGALNTSFVKEGEVSTPLSYVTGTLVKMGQGIERHISGGSAAAWLGYFLLYMSFIVGAAIGGGISLVANGSQMLAVATIVCSLTAGYTYFHSDRRTLVKESDSGRPSSVSLLRMIRKKSR